jgi:hypothetical protein
MPTMIREPYAVTLTPPSEAACRLPLRLEVGLIPGRDVKPFVHDHRLPLSSTVMTVVATS